MDLARDHRLSHPRLWPHHHGGARFGWPAVPASDRRGLHRDGVIRPPDHHVRLMVLPGVLDGAPRGRIASRQRARPPGRVHRALACGPAAPSARVLPAEWSTDILVLVKFPTAANF